MKKVIITTLVFLISVICIIGVNAEGNISVLVNGKNVEFDVEPIIVSDRTMVPMRATFEMLGANVEWVADMRMALATYGTNIIVMRIGEYSFSVTNVITNETVTYTLDVPAQIVNDRTLIPLRAVSEALGKKVEWDGNTRTAIITD